MVESVIPKNYTASPSSFTGTPQLTINRDVTADLDSTFAFEGPEKLLEVWFASSSSALPAGTTPKGLKAVSGDVWKEMLDLVNCKVLSVVESDSVDAYLLSESSMFVFPHKLILKTCGTTTLLYGLPRILEIAALHGGFPQAGHLDPAAGKAIAAVPYRVFYSRKNFLFPDRQRGPHRSWRDEVRSLDKLFLRGSAYMIGKMNGDHWYLYLTEPNILLTPPATPPEIKHETETKHLELPASTANAFANGSLGNSDEDETLEILMTDLAPEVSKQYYLDHASAVAEGRYYQQARRARKDAAHALGTIEEHATTGTFDVFEQTSSDHASTSSDDGEALPVDLTTEGHALGTVVTETTGLNDLYPTSKYPDAKIDAYLFTPCGYSANGVIPAPFEGVGEGKTADTHYFTVHVTPETAYSYASFETNVPTKAPGRETVEIVQQVVEIFKPGRFSVTLFEAKSEAGVDNGISTARKTGGMDTIKGYRRMDRIVHDLEGYDLVFRFYERNDWVGGEPRVGEP